MTRRGRKAFTGSLMMFAVCALCMGSGPATTQSTSAPASRPATAAIAEDAKPLLAKLSAAYDGMSAMTFDGKIIGNFDVAGRHKSYSLHVMGRTDGNGRYRHDADGAGLLVNDGENAYLFDSQRNEFGRLPATVGRAPAADLDQSIINVLLDENPALLLSITDDPAALLARAAKSIKLSAAGSGLVLELTGKLVTLKLDPSTDLIIESTIDYSPILASRGATAVHAASAVLTYAPSHPLASDTNTFTWEPPADATELQLGQELLKENTLTHPATTQP